MKYVIGVDLGTSATKTILVDQNGKIVAEGTHMELVEQHGYYYDLVKNQLELAN